MLSKMLITIEHTIVTGKETYDYNQTRVTYKLGKRKHAVTLGKMIFNKAKGHRDQNQTKALFKYKPDVTSMLSDLTKCL